MMPNSIQLTLSVHCGRSLGNDVIDIMMQCNRVLRVCALRILLWPLCGDIFVDDDIGDQRESECTESTEWLCEFETVSETAAITAEDHSDPLCRRSAARRGPVGGADSESIVHSL